ncbi:hypothetical protein MKW98_005665 [Papaver atlanticum]|uniref:Uncharacterized protein n=1 Tax=Papaver atlanticum TaxID=357466 RepID=A0AAD4STI2_9MAGN|nr:hypothetical protein MKW98_005665 [Papaver atlanticum]
MVSNALISLYGILIGDDAGLLVEFEDEDQLLWVHVEGMEMAVKNNKSGAVLGSMLCLKFYGKRLQPSMAGAVQEELAKAMPNHGYEIVQTLIVDIELGAHETLHHRQTLKCFQEKENDLYDLDYLSSQHGELEVMKDSWS